MKKEITNTVDKNKSINSNMINDNVRHPFESDSMIIVARSLEKLNNSMCKYKEKQLKPLVNKLFKDNIEYNEMIIPKTLYVNTPELPNIIHDKSITNIPLQELNDVVTEYKKDIIEPMINNNVIPMEYESRDISWMDFNKRVLDLTLDPYVPLLERLRFLGITANNLDEFQMVRLSSLIDHKDSIHEDINGLIPSQELEILNGEIKTFISNQYEIYDNLLEKLSENKIKLINNVNNLTPKGKKYINKYFKEKLYAMLTPIVFDNSRPFPLIRNKSIYIGVLLSDSRFDFNMFGTIQLPNMDRLIQIKVSDIPEDETHYILVEDIINANLNEIFIDKNIISECTFRVVRNFDEEVDSLKSNVFIVDKMKESLKRRESGDIIRLDITSKENVKKELIKIIQKSLKIDKDYINKFENKPIDLTFTMETIDKPELYYPKYSSQTGKDIIAEDNIFDAIDKGDLLLHHPYESFDTVIDLINQASLDDDVVTIKQTLYRLSDNSPIMKALIRAAENGKHVTVLLEVKARFDERNNLEWATKLERAGGHVIYGIDNLKTHCKMTLIVKRNKKGNLKNYCHLGTGNYNDTTAKIYTDMSLLTCDENISNDIVNLFNCLTGFSQPKLKKIISSPHHMRDKIYKLIDKEILNVEKGKQGKIFIKVNSFTDMDMCTKLYEAAYKGVEVELLVRGACSIKSRKNIKVYSIVGRFLEHSRIYVFNNNGKTKMYLASADMMYRNLNKRFETMFPISDSGIKQRIKDMIDTYRKDTTKYTLTEKGYVQEDKDKERYSAQEQFMLTAIDNAKVKNINKVFFRG